MANEHSASCLGYICTCDNCYRCEGIIKMLQAENARYREALEKIYIPDPVHYDGEMAFAYKMIAREALKDNKNNKEEE